MDFELVRCNQGDRWFPWNYGRRSGDARALARRLIHEPGLAVLNATSVTGRVLGSCCLQIGYRHSEHILGTEEYQYGALTGGPAYFWPDDDACPWILVLSSFWVRPAERRKGIARCFAEYARDIGLPAYLAFATKHVEDWFDEEFRPTGRASPLQARIVRAMRASAESEPPDEDPDFVVHLQAVAPALGLWSSWHGGLDEVVSLGRVLLSPDRAGLWDIDGGEGFEAGFSDSAYAEDRRFGYILAPCCESWGPDVGPFDGLPCEAPDEDYEAARCSYAQRSSFAAGTVDGWITEPEAFCSYAAVRHFLRTLTWRDFGDVKDAARELFIRDLRDEPRGMTRFNALIHHRTPADARTGVQANRLLSAQTR